MWGNDTWHNLWLPCMVKPLQKIIQFGNHIKVSLNSVIFWMLIFYKSSNFFYLILGWHLQALSYLFFRTALMKLGREETHASWSIIIIFHHWVNVRRLAVRSQRASFFYLSHFHWISIYIYTISYHEIKPMRKRI